MPIWEESLFRLQEREGRAAVSGSIFFAFLRMTFAASWSDSLALVVECLSQMLRSFRTCVRPDGGYNSEYDEIRYRFSRYDHTRVQVEVQVLVCCAYVLRF